MDFIPIYTKFIETEVSKLQLPNSPKLLYEPIRYFLNIGGKRIRPMMTLLGAELFDLQKENVVNAALAIELLHNFSLVHDDIMDNAPLRRGHQTVHEKWNSTIAILSGDAIIIKAYQLLQKQDGDLRALLQSFNKAAIEICEGQQLDMDFEEREDTTIEEYITMIRLKTSVLIGCSLELAAIIANCNEEDRKNSYDFGVNIGLSFQIQDDILDLYGDPEKFGKQIGGDIIANKKTMLYLLAKKNASKEQLIKLNKINLETNSTKKIDLAKKLFNELDVKRLAEEEATNYYLKALYNLNKINVLDKNKTKLKTISNYLLNRNK
ncbi:MAG: polyprenyl synthetase family protein [Crocinitomicaceae bacterium]|nr:polyprenyl synthetase family protein [Crocinitomicaceae bacterium]